MTNTNDQNMAILAGRWCGPAVYAVEHLKTGRRLVCATRCLSKRLSDQRRLLSKGEHWNGRLEHDLKVEGAAAFRLIVLELPNDHRQLPQLRQHRVQEARFGAGAYNAESDPARMAIHLDPQLIASVLAGHGHLPPSHGNTIGNL